MKKILLVILILFFSACSKKEGMTTSKIKISSGGYNALLTTKANNGMILYGKSTDGKTFAKKINADTADMVFPNGTWNFYAISWELGSGTGQMPNFAGKTYCGKSPSLTFNGTDASVQIDMTNSKCADTEFSAYYAYQTTPSVEVVLPKPNFLNCKDLSPLTGGGYANTLCDQNGGANFNKGYATS